MCKTTIYQLELNQREVDCGMSYVLQLKNGHFVMIDGGYFTDGEAERLYRFLKERTSEKIVIEGWFFSHAHQDHVGAFLNFVKLYHQDVTIETLYYNYQPIALPEEDVPYKSSDPATVKEFYRVVDSYFTPAQVHTLKTGEVLRFDDVTFEVLYTQEDLYPTESTFNDYSCVLMMEADGTKVLWLGDVYKLGCAWLLENKKEKLECDIVQISHHGYGGATEELYAALNAKTALWPMPDYMIGTPRVSQSGVDQYLIQASTIKEHIISGQGTAELEMPYQPGTAKRYTKEFFALFHTI